MPHRPVSSPGRCADARPGIAWIALAQIATAHLATAQLATAQLATAQLATAQLATAQIATAQIATALVPRRAETGVTSCVQLQGSSAQVLVVRCAQISREARWRLRVNALVAVFTIFGMTSGVGTVSCVPSRSTEWPTVPEARTLLLIVASEGRVRATLAADVATSGAALPIAVEPSDVVYALYYRCGLDDLGLQSGLVHSSTASVPRTERIFAGRVDADRSRVEWTHLDGGLAEIESLRIEPLDQEIGERPESWRIECGAELCRSSEPKEVEECWPTYAVQDDQGGVVIARSERSNLSSARLAPPLERPRSSEENGPVLLGDLPKCQGELSDDNTLETGQYAAATRRRGDPRLYAFGKKGFSVYATPLAKEARTEPVGQGTSEDDRFFLAAARTEDVHLVGLSRTGILADYRVGSGPDSPPTVRQRTSKAIDGGDFAGHNITGLVLRSERPGDLTVWATALKAGDLKILHVGLEAALEGTAGVEWTGTPISKEVDKNGGGGALAVLPTSNLLVAVGLAAGGADSSSPGSLPPRGALFLVRKDTSSESVTVVRVDPQPPFVFERPLVGLMPTRRRVLVVGLDPEKDRDSNRKISVASCELLNEQGPLESAMCRPVGVANAAEGSETRKAEGRVAEVFDDQVAVVAARGGPAWILRSCGLPAQD